MHGFVTRLLGALEDLLGGRVHVISNDIHCDRLLLCVLGGRATQLRHKITLGPGRGGDTYSKILCLGSCYSYAWLPCAAFCLA